MESSTSHDLNTLICLFHHKDQAQSAFEEIVKAGVPEQNVTLIGSEGSNIFADEASLRELNVPQKDLEHLVQGIQAGGVLVTVSAISNDADKVEAIFGRHKASQIDEALLDDDMSDRALLAPAPTANQAGVIPIVDEALVVGKRTVDAGAVRVFRRVVEIPVDASISLREEHVIVDRQAVDRPATEADLRQGGERIYELSETAEEAVVGKEARVVEEVLVSKGVTEHTEHIHDTVRHSEVEIEQIPAETEKQLSR